MGRGCTEITAMRTDVSGTVWGKAMFSGGVAGMIGMVCSGWVWYEEARLC